MLRMDQCQHVSNLHPPSVSSSLIGLLCFAKQPTVVGCQTAVSKRRQGAVRVLLRTGASHLERMNALGTRWSNSDEPMHLPQGRPLKQKTKIAVSPFSSAGCLLICTSMLSYLNQNKMARSSPKTPAPKPNADESSSKPLPADPEDLVVPLQRPGTSGTEAALKMTTRQASQRLRQAERAERAYRARKRSAAARANWASSKDNFRQAKEHFALGVKLMVAVVKGAPYVVREKQEARRAKRDEAKRKKVEEKRRKLEEKIAAVTAAERSEAERESDGEGLAKEG
ncbi:hypothetical protein N656DRAFT_307621 [Canariomyces notabilis]|uniref:Uncharacterized protein n=1 Tax=Canariomyces notabilis TaxID=2074819 RepID=A0AAN6QGT3_9PEZI|nr:hypothetical protein N656DRAFT_307621 [Canariomyces arenarius]